MAKIANEKVWLTEDRKIVKDGDPKAHELLAIKGQVIPDKRIAGVKGADEYFHDQKNPPVAKTVAAEAVAERHDRTIKPDHKRGK